MEENEILYNTFRIQKQVGRGGMGRVLLVKADRSLEGFHHFLASAIAWDEVRRHKKIIPLRERISIVNRNINKLLEKEAKVMESDVSGRQAELIRADIDEFRRELEKHVEIVKNKQQEYIDKRSTLLTAADPEAMIMHLRKLGIEYPDDDMFALKQVVIDDPEFKTRLHDEFRSLKVVHHPNILQVYDMGEDYYVMEYLSDIVDPETIIAQPDMVDMEYTNSDRLRIVIEAAKAVEYAHDFGLIHRDIKPDNIAVDTNGKVTLIDFGLVKSAETEGMTQTGVAMGTPNYMSPEQIKKGKEASPSFDIYALGATLYHYITGERPYRRARNRRTGDVKTVPSIQEVFLTVIDPKFGPIPPSQIAKGIPKVLEDITLKAMAKERKHRYQSIKTFRTDLERYLSFTDNNTLNASDFFSIKAREVKMRVHRRDKHAEAEAKPADSKKALWKIGIGTAAVIAILTALILIYTQLQQTADTQDPLDAQKESQEEKLKGMLEYAEQYAKENPQEYRSCMDKYNAVYQHGRGTKFELMAVDRMNEIKKNWGAHRKRVLTDLYTQAKEFADKKDFESALKVYEQYTGPLAKDIVKEREQKVLEIKRTQRQYLAAKIDEEQRQKERERLAKAEADRKKKEEAERKQAELEEKREQVRAEMPQLAQEIFKKITAGEYKAASDLLKEKSGKKEYNVVKGTLTQLLEVVKAGAGIRKGLLTYIEKNKGKELTITRVTGKSFKGIIDTIQDDVLEVTTVFEVEGEKGQAKIKIGLKEISLKQLIKMSASDFSDKHCAMVWFLKASAQGNAQLADALQEKIKDHALLVYAKDTSADQTDTSDTVISKKDEPEIEQGNLLPFGDFEKGLGHRFKGWTFSEGPGSLTFRDIRSPHNGRSALRIENIEKTRAKRACFGKKKLKVKPNQAYNITFWMKTEDFKGTDCSAGVKVLTSTGDIIFDRKLLCEPTQEWRKYYVSINPGPVSEVDVVFGVWQATGGKVWFDDASMEKDEGNKWTDLLVGNTKRESGWYCDGRLKAQGFDNFRLSDGKLKALPNRRSSVARQTLLGDIELEFKYSMKGLFWHMYIADSQQVIDIRCDKSGVGNHHARLIIKGMNAEFFLDGAQILPSTSRTGVVFVFVDRRGGKSADGRTMVGRLGPRGLIGINQVQATEIELTDLKYRQLK
jgi:serine/threonine protein kinase